MCTRGFLGSLITNLKLLLKNYIVETIGLNKLCLRSTFIQAATELIFLKTKSHDDT